MQHTLRFLEPWLLVMTSSEGSWTVESSEAWDNMVLDVLNTSPGHRYVIADVRLTSPHIPRGVLNSRFRSPVLKHPHLAGLVFVANSGVARYVAEIGQQLLRLWFGKAPVLRAMPGYDEAERYLREVAAMDANKATEIPAKHAAPAEVAAIG